jgi:hypothetical protein
MEFINRHSLKLMISLAIAIAAVAGIYATASHAGSSSTLPAPQTLPYPTVDGDANAAADRVAAFHASFGLLRDAPNAVSATSVIRDPQVERGEAHALSLASEDTLARAEATRPHAAVWIAARTDGSECLLAQPADAQGPAESCFTPDQALKGYAVMTQSRNASDVDLYGLVPDGVNQVSVTFTDGSTSGLPVVRNGYAAHFEKPTASVAFTDADGVRHELIAGIDG